MSEAAPAFPLAWPAGWKRTPPSERRPARFSTMAERSGNNFRSRRAITMAEARERMADEMEKLGALGEVLSTNVPLRMDGQPRSGQPEPADPGAAIYFRMKGRPMVLACDRWDTVAGNVAALAAHLNALRGMERWGVGTAEQVFTGYAALPPPVVPDDWRAALGSPRTLVEAEAAWRERMREAHPDRGGSHAQAAALNAAIAMARKEMRS